MKSKILFLKHFFKNPKMTGAIAPSSKHLANEMLKSIDFEKDSVIVEYGPGDGVFTKEIIKQKTDKTILIVIELNGKMYDELHSKYNHKNVYILNDSAENIPDILKDLGLNSIDYIVSGIPFTSIDKSISDNIFKNTIKCMGFKSKFITFQYSKVKLKMFLNFFGEIKIKKVWRNIPPAYVFTCQV